MIFFNLEGTEEYHLKLNTEGEVQILVDTIYL